MEGGKKGTPLLWVRVPYAEWAAYLAKRMDWV
jgi:hypothetical protein